MVRDEIGGAERRTRVTGEGNWVVIQDIWVKRTNIILRGDRNIGILVYQSLIQVVYPDAILYFCNLFHLSQPATGYVVWFKFYLTFHFSSAQVSLHRASLFAQKPCHKEEQFLRSHTCLSESVHHVFGGIAFSSCWSIS